MDKRFATGEMVKETGIYICEAGEKRHYPKGKAFDICPITDKNTKWRKIEKNG